MRIIVAKLPRLMQSKVRGLMQHVFRAPNYAALERGRDLIVNFKDRYPAAMECSERRGGVRHFRLFQDVWT